MVISVTPMEMSNVPAARLPQHIEGLRADPQFWPSEMDRGSAVCVLFLIAGDGDAHLVLIRRSTNISSHRGQIGFPGGRRDPEDKSPTETALRELEEEIGLAADRLQVHGLLPPIHGLDGSPVYPLVVSSTDGLHQLNPNPEEVAGIISAPWKDFQRTHDDPFHFKLFGLSRSSHLFRVQSNMVWGLTARIIYLANFY